MNQQKTGLILMYQPQTDTYTLYEINSFMTDIPVDLVQQLLHRLIISSNDTFKLEGKERAYGNDRNDTP